MRLRDVGRFACRAPVLFMKKHSHIMVGGNFSSYGPYENNQPIYTSDRYGDHGVGFNQDIYKYCTYGDVKLNYTKKTFDDAIKQNVAKPRGFHIYAGGLVFGGCQKFRV